MINLFHQSLKYEQQQILNKKRGSVELDEEEQRKFNLTKIGENNILKNDNNNNDDDDDDDDDKDVSTLASTKPNDDGINSTNSTNENETKKLQSNEHSKKQKTLSKLKQCKDVRTEQIELIEEEHKWFRKHTNFLYNADDLDYIFNRDFKLTVTEFDKIN